MNHTTINTDLSPLNIMKKYRIYFTERTWIDIEGTTLINAMLSTPYDANYFRQMVRWEEMS